MTARLLFGHRLDAAGDASPCDAFEERRRAANGNVPPFRQSGFGPPPKRIAILDPSGVEARLLRALAEAQGHRVVCAADPEAFVRCLHEEQPDLGLVHIWFRGALEKLRASPGCARVPLVLIDSSGVRGSGPLREVSGLPALSFPISLEEIAAVVRRHAR